jgi:hypothetical protein
MKYWELIPEDGEVVGVICPECLTSRSCAASVLNRISVA